MHHCTECPPTRPSHVIGSEALPEVAAPGAGYKRWIWWTALTHAYYHACNTQDDRSRYRAAQGTPSSDKIDFGCRIVNGDGETD
mmetsp:Transcript_86119/g.143315  ORF Transcript_86119/g.143315 Transcript_86119/m.143315 type:complete len:84 (-) Transcript_86119:17-268(-)